MQEESKREAFNHQSLMLRVRHRLKQLETILIIAFAASLPLSLTLSEGFFIAGSLIWLLLFVFEKNSGGIKPELLEKNNSSAPENATEESITEESTNQDGAARESAPDESRKKRIAPLTAPILLMALAITVSGAFNGGSAPGSLGPDSIAEAWRSFYSLKTMLLYFWAFSLFGRNRNAAFAAILVFLWLTSIAGVWGSIQQIFNIHPGKYRYLQGTGFFSHPMAFAGQMQVSSLLALGFFLSSAYKNFGSEPAFRFLNSLGKFSSKTPVFVFVLLANFAGLFFAGERSAWFGGACGVLCLCLLKSWRFAAGALVLMAAAFCAAWFSVPLLRTRVESLFSGKDISITARQEIWTECLTNHFQKSPIFGIGWMKFPHFDIPEAIVPGVSRDLNHAHSNYVQFLTCAGIVGLLSYLVFIAWTLVYAFREFQKSMHARDQIRTAICFAVSGVTVSLACSGIFEFNFGTAPQVRLAQMLILALL